jgi:hypothetical protein
MVGCLLAPPNSAHSQDAAGNGPSTINGTVINAVTHDPIGRALVYSSDNRFATFTDTEGRFEFSVPASNDVRSLPSLSARKPGFLDDPDGTSHSEASPGAELTISLLPEGLIKGRVNLSAPEAAAGITVQVFSRQVTDGVARWEERSNVRANSNGEFRIADLPQGSYKLLTREFMDNDPVTTIPSGQAYGFPPIYYPNATDFASASTIQLAAGQAFQADILLVRHPYFPVRIPVTNAEEIRGLEITVSPQGHRGPGYSLGYNTQKQRIEGSLPSGNYLVEAASFGQNPLSGVAHLAVAGAPTEAAPMVLTRNASILVNVKEEFALTNWSASGKINSGGRVFAMPKLRLDLNLSVESAEEDFGRQRGGTLRPPTGPADNSLVLEDLAPGRYWLRPRPTHGYVASATMGGVDLLRQPFVVGLGATVPIEITMRDDSAEIEGAVAGVNAMARTSEAEANNGLSKSFAHIYCVPLPDSAGQYLEFSASSDGKFDYEMVAPGTYHLLAFKNQRQDLPYRDPEAMRAYDGKGQIVHVSAGEKATVQLQLIAGSD